MRLLSRTKSRTENSLRCWWCWASCWSRACAAGVLKRQTHDRRWLRAPRIDAGRAPVVNVGHVRRRRRKSTIELPGRFVARVETPMYARVDGYLKQRPVDIGDRVKKGDLLVEIDTPDLDAQIAMSQATLAQSKAASAATQRRAGAWQRATPSSPTLTAERYKFCWQRRHRQAGLRRSRGAGRSGRRT